MQYGVRLQQGARLIDCRVFPPAGRVAVPGKSEHTGHIQPIALHGRRDLPDAWWCDTGAMVAAVDFHHDLRLGPGERAGQKLYSFDRVGTNPEGDSLGKGAQSEATRSGSPHRIGDEQVGETHVREELRLTHGRHRQTDRAECLLAAGDLHTLVGLGVRAQCHAVLTCAVGHSDEISFQHVAVDHQTRSLKIRRQRR
jgi:hypothetical protein